VVMIRVLHRSDARARKNIRKHLLELLELGRHFLKQCVVMRVLPSGGRDYGRGRVYLSGGDENKAMAAQAAVVHRVPVTRKPFVTAASRPNVRRAFSLLMIAQQVSAIIRVAEPLHLKTQLVV